MFFVLTLYTYNILLGRRSLVMFAKILVMALEAAAVAVVEGILTGVFENEYRRRVRKPRIKK